jgi:hypothetical protein
MKFMSLLAALCAVSELAVAQTSTCQSISKDADRLACYDKAAPPAFANKRAARKALSDEQGQYVDRLATENARVDAKLKNICRGC